MKSIEKLMSDNGFYSKFGSGIYGSKETGNWCIDTSCASNINESVTIYKDGTNDTTPYTFADNLIEAVDYIKSTGVVKMQKYYVSLKIEGIYYFDAFEASTAQKALKSALKNWEANTDKIQLGYVKSEHSEIGKNEISFT